MLCLQLPQKATPNTQAASSVSLSKEHLTHRGYSWVWLGWESELGDPLGKATFIIQFDDVTALVHYS